MKNEICVEGRTSRNIPFALLDGQIVKATDSHIKSGLSCGCTCPHCDKPLSAGKGKKRVHYFAHKAGQGCKWGRESSIHRMAKQIILENPEVFFLQLKIEESKTDKDYNVYSEVGMLPVVWG